MRTHRAPDRRGLLVAGAASLAGLAAGPAAGTPALPPDVLASLVRDPRAAAPVAAAYLRRV